MMIILNNNDDSKYLQIFATAIFDSLMSTKLPWRYTPLLLSGAYCIISFPPCDLRQDGVTNTIEWSILCDQKRVFRQSKGANPADRPERAHKTSWILLSTLGLLGIVPYHTNQRIYLSLLRPHDRFGPKIWISMVDSLFGINTKM